MVCLIQFSDSIVLYVDKRRCDCEVSDRRSLFYYCHFTVHFAPAWSTKQGVAVLGSQLGEYDGVIKRVKVNFFRNYSYTFLLERKLITFKLFKKREPGLCK